MAQIGLLVLAVGLLFVGVQGLRGVPDSTGKKTSKGVAVTCIVLAVETVGALVLTRLALARYSAAAERSAPVFRSPFSPLSRLEAAASVTPRRSSITWA